MPDTAVEAVPAVATEAASMLNRMSLAGLTGGALGGLVSRGVASVRKSHIESTRIEVLAEELSKQPNNPAVQHWHTDSTGFDSRVVKLSQRPGIHAVHLAEESSVETTPRSSQWG